MHGLAGRWGWSANTVPGDTSRLGRGTFRPPLPNGDSPWIPCPGRYLSGSSHSRSRARPTGSIATDCPPPLRGRGAGSEGCSTRDAGDRGDSTSTHCSAGISTGINTTPSPRSCFCPRPRGLERDPSLYVESLNRGAPGAEDLSKCPGRLRVRSCKVGLKKVPGRGRSKG